MKKRTILFAGPSHYNLYKMITKHLKLLGFDVYTIAIDSDFRYLNKKDRIVNLFRKVFLRDKKYKQETLYYKYKTAQLNSLLDSIPVKTFDYSFFIRPDMYPIEIVKQITKLSNKSSCYQWDGLDRYPNIYKYISLFDRFFVFDKTDLDYQDKKLLPCSNFYYDHDKNFIKINDCNSDVFFVGTFLKPRMQQISTFINKANSLNQTLNFNILCHSEKQILSHPLKQVNYISDFISYEDSLNLLKHSKMVIDFKTDAHNGLSFRTFEALYYEKKLITNNPLVKNYDFYNPENIFYWDGESLEGYEEFIKKPYQSIDEDIKQKYSFSNWINYILDIKPYIPISLF